MNIRLTVWFGWAHYILSFFRHVHVQIYFLICVVGKKNESYEKNENIDFNSFVYTKHKKGSTSANSPCLNCLFDMPCGPFTPTNVTSSFYINGFW